MFLLYLPPHTLTDLQDVLGSPEAPAEMKNQVNVVWEKKLFKNNGGGWGGMKGKPIPVCSGRQAVILTEGWRSRSRLLEASSLSSPPSHGKFLGTPVVCEQATPTEQDSLLGMKAWQGACCCGGLCVSSAVWFLTLSFNSS